jgi:hypothetical protein
MFSTPLRPLPVRLVTHRPGVLTPLYSKHYADTFALDGANCPMCLELVDEARERMTAGGAQVWSVE